ncbi:hypothetical protein [Streptomyces sp. NPDC101776]|uniref:hypothetical protein n=1 Tax=Streptomyces sp. NPDC101776 TaxID=3366146 RepID=UPI0037FC51FD
MSTATTAAAYRHFSPVEEVLHAFRAQVGSELRDFSAAQTTRGMQRLETVSRYFDPCDILDLIKSGRTEDDTASRLVAASRHGARAGRVVAVQNVPSR